MMNAVPQPNATGPVMITGAGPTGLAAMDLARCGVPCRIIGKA
jgi:hypothetical protein